VILELINSLVWYIVTCGDNTIHRPCLVVIIFYVLWIFSCTALVYLLRDKKEAYERIVQFVEW